MMNILFDNAIDIAGLLIGAVGLYAIFYQLRQSNLQQRLLLFTEYTQRFQSILRTAPDDLFQPNNGSQMNCSVENLRTIRLYLDLCSEEYHLHQLGYIDEDVWENWKEGMDFLLRKTEIQNALDNVLQTSSHNASFRAFILDLRGASNPSQTQ